MEKEKEIRKETPEKGLEGREFDKITATIT